MYTSANGVVLTPGDERGIVGVDMWRRAERVMGGQRVVVWEDGREVGLDGEDGGQGDGVRSKVISGEA